MKKNIIILIFILVFVAILFLLDLPAYSKAAARKGELEQYKEFLKQKEEIVVKVEQLKQIYESRKNDFNKVFYVLPMGKDIPNLIVQFEALCSENGLVLERLNFVQPTATTTRNVAAEDVEWGATSQPSQASGTPVVSQRDYKTLDVSLSLSGNYQSFQSFLQALESNIRLMDIKSINFSLAEETSGGFTFDINLQVYYQ